MKVQYALSMSMKHGQRGQDCYLQIPITEPMQEFGEILLERKLFHHFMPS